MSTPQLLNIPVSQIEDNPVALRAVARKSKEYQQLVDSVKRDGILCSITVVPALDATGKTVKTNAAGAPMYRIVDGLHRTSAARDVGLATVPAQVLNKTEAEIHIAQLVANSHTIETKHHEYAKHLARILSADYTMTAAQLCAKLSMSPTWLSERLNLVKLSDAIGKLVDEGKIPVTNAVELSKLPEDEQEAFLSDAMNETVSVFAPKVKQRIKQLREDARKGRDPNAPTGFIPVPHMRKFQQIKEAFENPNEVLELIDRKGISTVPEAIKFVLSWACHMDEASIEAAKAAADARKAAEDVKKAERKAERAAKEAAEAAEAAEKAKSGALAGASA